MYLVTANSKNDLLIVSFLEHVVPDDVKSCRAEIAEIMIRMSPSFRLLTDLSHLESMDYTCADEIRAMMDQFRTHGVSLIVRVIPNRRKDIGFTTMSYFHYGRDVSVVTVESITEGLSVLAS